jgi:hypothetical protein
MFIPQMIYEYGESQWNDIDMGKCRTQGITCPCATLSTTNATWAELGLDSRLATNRQSHGMAIKTPNGKKILEHGICLQKRHVWHWTVLTG